MVCLDRVCDAGGLGDPPSVENAADPAARDILQSSLAHCCGVPSVGNGQVGGFAGGRHHLGVLVGVVTHHRRTLGLCVCELHIQGGEVDQVAHDHQTYSRCARPVPVAYRHSLIPLVDVDAFDQQP